MFVKMFGHTFPHSISQSFRNGFTPLFRSLLRHKQLIVEVCREFLGLYSFSYSSWTLLPLCHCASLSEEGIISFKLHKT